MSADPGYRRPLEAFGQLDAPSLVVRKFSKSTLALTEVRGAANHGMTPSIPHDDAFLVQLRMLDCARCDYFSEGRRVGCDDHHAGVIQLHDLRRDPTVELRDPFRVLHFYLPRAALNAVAAEVGGATIDALELEPGQCAEDATARHLLLSLLRRSSALRRPVRSSWTTSPPRSAVILPRLTAEYRDREIRRGAVLRRGRRAERKSSWSRI
jgi:AraC family transcriptional regulator